MMKRISVSVPEIGIIAGSRAAVGAGAALLLGGLLKPEHRKAVGWTLLVIGAISTIPIATQIFRSQLEDEEREHTWGRVPQQEHAR